MNAKHTPGPWHVFDASATQQMIVNEATTIAKTMCGNDRANARLIAAAPELLEALQEVFEQCDGYVPNTSKAAWAKAYAAIAKATGERP